MNVINGICMLILFIILTVTAVLGFIVQLYLLYRNEIDIKINVKKEKIDKDIDTDRHKEICSWFKILNESIKNYSKKK